MIEKDKEYYNKKISELYAVIENQEKVIRELQEDLQDYERIFDIWNKRKLIKKFNKEFSKKTVKEERAKGNKIVGAIPDAEYVYKKYYEKLEQLDLYKQRIDKALKHTHEILGFLENCVGGNEKEIQNCIKIFNKYLEILKGEENN